MTTQNLQVTNEVLNCHPTIGAYELGRLVWRLTWDIEQASLLGTRQSISFADQAFSDLLTRLSGVISPKNLARTEGFIEQKRDDTTANCIMNSAANSRT
jgi:hypothetical protein